MVDIRSNDEIPPIDIFDWIVTVLNDGCPYYEFSPNSSDPDNPYKILSGNLLMDIFTSLPVNLGDSVDIFDKYRHRATLKFWVTK
jgi:hypothetical protein